MAEQITIDPITRIEGHHGIKLTVDNGVVTDAQALALMFRGFERVVVGRDPRDAPILLQRICGVCHNDHRLTSLMAIENAAGLADEWNSDLPAPAIAMRNLVATLQFIYDHAAWVYVLAGPDYSDNLYNTGLTRLNPITGTGVREAIWAQRELHRAMAYIGGKVPHMMTPSPGGFTLEIDENIITKLVGVISDVKYWATGLKVTSKIIDNVDAVLAVEDEVWKQQTEILAGTRTEFTPPGDGGKGAFDMVSLISAAANAGANNAGVWENPNMLAYGFLPDPETGELYFPPGFYTNGQVQEFDYKQISEDVSHSWYEDDTQTDYVGNDGMLKPAVGKSGAYSWGKAPRYGGKPAEVGPLPRLVALGAVNPAVGDLLGLRAKFCGSAQASTALSRTIARIQEELIMIDYAQDLLLSLANYAGKKVSIEFPDKFTGSGLGLREAPRGALGHWVNVENGKIKNYQCVVPTTWNVSPKDSANQHGPIENAAIGTAVNDAAAPIDVVRAIHSFDPCLACTVHVFTPDGKKYHVE